VDVAALLLETYGRIPPLVRRAVQDLDAEELVRAPEPGANTIGWLIWHLTRIEDDHVSELMQTEQVWVSSGVAAQFGLSSDPGNIGYGHTAADVARVRPESARALVEYHAAVDARVRPFVASLTDADLDRIVDRNWDPPVTMGVRLVSVASDCLQHVGQAAYLRGLFGH
jgi:uncharacterized damage-inducible protein DinB